MDLFPRGELSPSHVSEIPAAPRKPEKYAGNTVDHKPSPTPEPATSRERKRILKLLADALRMELESASGRTIVLVITNNTSNMMSIAVDPETTSTRLRLHHMFLDAPEDVREALVHRVKHPGSRKYGECLRSFIASRTHLIRQVRPTPARTDTKGAVYDLRPIFDELNATYFDGNLDVAITWGRKTSSAGRSIRFGSYYEATKLIRIHRRLDQSFVPIFVVRYIVYHEMLHAHLGLCRNEKGRRQIHSRTFKNIEQAYPEYRQAVSWIENSDNLDKILDNRKGKRKKKYRRSGFNEPGTYCG